MKDEAVIAEGPISEIGMGAPRLEKIVGAASLAETASSAADLFGVPVSIFSTSGTQLAGDPLGEEVLVPALALARGMAAPADVRGASAERYRLRAIEYDGRAVGAIV